MKIQESLDKLKEGNTRFVANFLDGKAKDNLKKLYLDVEPKPYAIILSCADSRVVPEFVFDTRLGELFVIRVAGNVANKSSIASIEYAVANMGSKLIVVMGHQGCLAVNAAIQGGDNGININHLLAHIEPAINESKKGASINNIIKKNAKLSASELIAKSKILKEAIGNKTIKIVSAYYHIDTGKVDFI